MRKALFSIFNPLIPTDTKSPAYSNTASISPKRQVPRPIWPAYGKSPANKRAAARLEAHRKILDDTPSADTMSRQRRRRAAMGRV